MLRQATRTCVFCEVRPLLGPQLQPVYQQTRLYAQFQRDQGSRYGTSDARPPRPAYGGGPPAAGRGRDAQFQGERSPRTGASDSRPKPTLGGRAPAGRGRDAQFQRDRDPRYGATDGRPPRPASGGRPPAGRGYDRNRSSQDGASDSRPRPYFRGRLPTGRGRDAQFQRDRSPRYDASDSRPRPTSGGRPPAGRGRDRPRPDRMVLSDTVGRPPPSSSSEKRPARKPQDPFGHLNKTQVPPSLERRRNQDDKGGHFASRRKEDDKRRSRTEPFHALKMQKSLQDVSYGSRTAIKRKIQQVDSFEGLPLSDKMQEAIKDALPGLEYRNPTPAQAVAIPALLGITAKQRTRNPAKKSGLETFLLAAETGSGKTLAYLLPTIDIIKREEVIDAEEQAREETEQAAAREREKRDDEFALESPPVGTETDPARPRAIILVPSAELVAQVGAVAKSLSHTVKFKAAPISAKNTPAVIRSRLFNEKGVDVVISTPPLLASIVESNPNILSRVTHLIVDEADSLFDRSFKPSTTEIIEKAAPSLKKLILCSATIPRYLDKYLEDRYPSMTRLVTPNLHAIPRRVQLGVVQVDRDPYRGNKMLACADTIWQIGKAKGDYDPADGKESVATKNILVFVNEREVTEEVAEYLVKKGIDAIAFHRDTDTGRQAKTLASFTGITKDTTDNAKEVTSTADIESNKRRLPNTKVIVTTDLGSRGIDTVSVRHVILYDVPHTTIDFIHRLGRTGRMGRRGRGIVLAGSGDRHDVIKEVRDAMFRGEALI